MPPPPSHSHVDYPFYQDLRAAVAQLVQENIQAQCSYLSNGLVYLDPPNHLLHTGCWCPNAAWPSYHNWTQCPNTWPPLPAIVSPWTIIRRCWHLKAEDQQTSRHRLFCFSPTTAVEGFMDWLIQPRPVLQGHLGLNSVQANCVERCLQEYDYCCPVEGASGPFAERYDALCRLLVEMRGSDISLEARMACSWHVERVHSIMDWKRKPFLECINALTRVMETAARNRISLEAQAQRAPESR